MSSPRRDLGVAVVGMGWMGRVHGAAYARVAHHFPDLPVRPRLVAVADELPERGRAAVDQLGFERAVTDWRELLDDPLVEAVSITSPNYLHREMGVAAAQAGRHVWIEKPVGRSSAETADVAAAVAAAGVRSTVGFNYRQAPAVQHARALIADGRIGTPTHARVQLLADYAAHPDGAFSWRFQRDLAGSGVLGDLASHGVDLVRFLLGDVEAVVADVARFILRRPVPTAAGTHFARSSGGPLREVENEDWVGGLLRLQGGARATLEASRVAVGEQCSYGFEVHGSRGLVAWDFRRLGELRLSVGDDYADQSVSTLFVGPGHGGFAAFQPAPGIAMGYDDLKVLEAEAFLRSIASGRAHGPTVDDALVAARTLDAMAESARTGAWVGVEHVGGRDVAEVAS